MWRALPFARDTGTNAVCCPRLRAFSLQMLWWYTVILNTLYSFLWDVYKDWGMGYPRDPKGRSQYLFLRPQLDYRRPWLYYFVVVQNLLLRACWSLKLSSHLQEYATGAAVVIMFEIFEVYRRWAWIYGRVEWECIDKNVRTARCQRPARAAGCVATGARGNGVRSPSCVRRAVLLSARPGRTRAPAHGRSQRAPRSPSASPGPRTSRLSDDLGRGAVEPRATSALGGCLARHAPPPCACRASVFMKVSETETRSNQRVNKGSQGDVPVR